MVSGVSRCPAWRAWAAPSPLHVGAMESICGDTIAGFLYYCDEQDAHGNADSQSEAEHMATTHQEYLREHRAMNGDDEPEVCEVITWQPTSHERTKEKTGRRSRQLNQAGGAQRSRRGGPPPAPGAMTSALTRSAHALPAQVSSFRTPSPSAA